MHYEIHDSSSGTQLLLLHGGLFDIHQQFDELLPGKLTERPIDPPTTLDVHWPNGAAVPRRRR